MMGSGNDISGGSSDEQKERIALIIQNNYVRLKTMCCNNISFNAFDVFHDTIEYVLRCADMSQMMTDEEVIHYFCYKYRMFKYRAIMTVRQRREISYADYIQTQETRDETY